MANIPSNLSYGTVTGRFIVAYQDSNDSGSEPDAIPAAGSIFFTASPLSIKNILAEPSPVTILPAVVEAKLDSEGYLCGYGTTRGIILVATDDEDGNPVNWTWRADFRLTDSTGVALSVPSFSFELPGGSSVDLTDLSPVSESNGVPIIVGPKGDTGTLEVGTVTTGTPTSPVTVTNVGTNTTAILNFSIPKGDTGSLGNFAATSPLTYISNTIAIDYSALTINGGTP